MSHAKCIEPDSSNALFKWIVFPWLRMRCQSGVSILQTKWVCPSPQTERIQLTSETECSWLRSMHTLYAREESGKLFSFVEPKIWVYKNGQGRKSSAYLLSNYIQRPFVEWLFFLVPFCSHLTFASVNCIGKPGGVIARCGGKVHSQTIASILHKYRSIHCINLRIVENCTSRAS